MNIILADDHEIMTDGLRSIIIENDQYNVVGTASNGIEALQLMKEQNVDLAILDIRMPKMDGIQATKVIKEHYPNTRVLILTTHNTPEFISRVHESGADGYLLKNAGKNEVLQAIQVVASGKKYFMSEVAMTLLQSSSKEGDQAIRLTNRELEVLQLINSGFSTKVIADNLNIAFNTVEFHRKNLHSKFQVNSSIQLLKKAAEKGLI